MKALYVAEAAPEPVLEVRDVPTPEAGTGEVVIEVAAAGLCGHDIAIMTGLLRRGVDRRVVLGHEVSGRVAQVGDGVSGLSEGDAVLASLTAACGACDRCAAGMDYRCREGSGVGHGVDGGFAEFVRLPAVSVTPLPDGVDLASACLIACPIGVAVRAAKSVARLGAGESALVTGAGGGLGHSRGPGGERAGRGAGVRGNIVARETGRYRALHARRRGSGRRAGLFRAGDGVHGRRGRGRGD